MQWRRRGGEGRKGGGGEGGGEGDMMRGPQSAQSNPYTQEEPIEPEPPSWQ